MWRAQARVRGRVQQQERDVADVLSLESEAHRRATDPPAGRAIVGGVAAALRPCAIAAGRVARLQGHVGRRSGDATEREEHVRLRRRCRAELMKLHVVRLVRA